MPFDYPYSLTGKLRYFPWKFHWQKGRFIRYLTVSYFIGVLVIGRTMSKISNSPANKELWVEKRKQMYRGYFEFDPKKDRQ